MSMKPYVLLSLFDGFAKFLWSYAIDDRIRLIYPQNHREKKIIETLVLKSTNERLKTLQKFKIILQDKWVKGVGGGCITICEIVVLIDIGNVYVMAVYTMVI